MAGKIFSEVYNESARDTGDTTPAHITYVKRKVNDALRTICQAMGYSWLKRTANITLTSGLQYYAMLSLAPLWDEDTPVNVFYRNSGNERTILDCFDDNEWMIEEDLDSGDCYGFNVSKKSGAWRISFTKVPNDAFVGAYSPLVMEYQILPTELSGDSDIPCIPSSFHQGLVYFTNKLICAEMGDDAGVVRWSALSDEVFGLMKKRQTMRTGRPKRAYPRGCVVPSNRSNR